MPQIICGIDGVVRRMMARMDVGSVDRRTAAAFSAHIATLLIQIWPTAEDAAFRSL